MCIKSRGFKGLACEKEMIKWNDFKSEAFPGCLDPAAKFESFPGEAAKADRTDSVLFFSVLDRPWKPQEQLCRVFFASTVLNICKHKWKELWWLDFKGRGQKEKKYIIQLKTQLIRKSVSYRRRINEPKNQIKSVSLINKFKNMKYQKTQHKNINYIWCGI